MKSQIKAKFAIIMTILKVISKNIKSFCSYFFKASNNIAKPFYFLETVSKRPNFKMATMLPMLSSVSSSTLLRECGNKSIASSVEFISTSFNEQGESTRTRENSEAKKRFFF